MKYLNILIFLLIGSTISGQDQSFTHLGIKIDGSISFNELRDTTFWTTVSNNKSITIRESKYSHYIAVKSNIYTSVNLYLPSKNLVRVMHVSYSLGDNLYFRNGSIWNPSESAYHWKYRDPILRSLENFSEEITEFYDSDSSRQIEMSEYYKNNRWVANTMPAGSHREIEVIISKKLMPTINDLVLAYLMEVDGKPVLQYFPASIDSITDDLSVDRKLQNGELPDITSFKIMEEN